ncbi:hypothetical protein IC806_00010 [Geobacillus zalihae]|nr:hypothetical protein IC806_00010 [Geobacillus zalihae]
MERKVYYTRNLCFVPAPLIESDPELVEWLHRKMVEDRNRPHYEKGRWIEELWQEEQPELLALPEQDLPIFSLDHAYVNKYGEVMVDGKAFVVHGLSVPNRVLVKKEWNRFVVFSSDGDVHLEAPRPYTNVKREIPGKRFSLSGRPNPGCRTFPLPDVLAGGDPNVSGWPPPQVVARLKGLRALLDRHTLYEIAQWLEESQRWDLTPHEIGVLMEAKHSYYPDKWEESYTPSVLIDYETDLTVYDQRLHPAREGVSRNESRGERDL